MKEPVGRIYSAIVYCKFLQHNIRLAYTQFLDEQGKVKTYKLFFSTDTNLSAHTVVRYYQSRFQQEFLIRDAKPFTASTTARPALPTNLTSTGIAP